MNMGTLKQILLITDGCSNSGVSPMKTARDAFEMGVTVNVIGVLDSNQSETDEPFQEIEKIAASGGGIHQIVYKENLSQTVQAVTTQAISQTIQGFINKELSQIFGKDQSLAEVDPEKREEVMEVVDELEETSQLEVLILVDTSASMHHKLMTVKEALLDLSMNLQARTGTNKFAVYQFPKRKQPIGVIHDWAEQLESISVIFPKLITGGLTPTGPAIRAALEKWEENRGYGYAQEG